MTDLPADRVKMFDEVVNGALQLLSIARDNELQSAAINNLSSFQTTLKRWKEEAVAEKVEAQANLVLGMQCFVSALIAELNMWLLLKANNPDDAWGNLIDAQSATTHAIRAHPNFGRHVSHAEHLYAIEKVVFPRQVFLSSGLIVSSSICTICNDDYDGCPHLVGMPYWGEFCFRRLKDVQADHVAIVDDPASKRCRITHFSDEGGRRNRMTWCVEPADGQMQSLSGQGGLVTSGIVLTLDDLVS